MKNPAYPPEYKCSIKYITWYPYPNSFHYFYNLLITLTREVLGILPSIQVTDNEVTSRAARKTNSEMKVLLPLTSKEENILEDPGKAIISSPLTDG